MSSTRPYPNLTIELEEREYTLNDVEQLVAELEPLVLPAWPTFLDADLLSCRDTTNTRALAYTCAISTLARRHSLPPPPAMVASYTVRALRVRLDPSATLRTGDDRCDECIADGWVQRTHGWIGCWGVGGHNCAVCVAMKRRECSLPHDGEDYYSREDYRFDCAEERDDDDYEPAPKRRRTTYRRAAKARGPSYVTRASGAPSSDTPEKEASEAPSSDLSEVPESGDESGEVPESGDESRPIEILDDDSIDGLEDESADEPTNDHFAHAASVLLGSEDAQPGTQPDTMEPPPSPNTSSSDSLDEVGRRHASPETAPVTANGEEDASKSVYPTPPPATPTRTSSTPTQSPARLKTRVRALVLKFDRLHRAVDDVLRLNDPLITHKFLADADEFRLVAQDVACDPAIQPDHADGLLVGWDRVEHYLAHVIRLRDAQMVAVLRADAAEVKRVVGEIAAGVV